MLAVRTWWTACRLKQAERAHASQRAETGQFEQRFAIAKEELEEARKKGEGTTKADRGMLKEAEAKIQAQDARIAELLCASFLNGRCSVC
jgi:hypothetical protein